MLEMKAAGWTHIALRGRLDPKTLSVWRRILLRIGAWTDKDHEARREELEGFDFMDQAAIAPIVEWVKTRTPSSVQTSA